jgi:hypothetical protein
MAESMNLLGLPGTQVISDSLRRIRSEMTCAEIAGKIAERGWTESVEREARLRVAMTASLLDEPDADKFASVRRMKRLAFDGG